MNLQRQERARRWFKRAPVFAAALALGGCAGLFQTKTMPVTAMPAPMAQAAMDEPPAMGPPAMLPAVPRPKAKPTPAPRTKTALLKNHPAPKQPVRTTGAVVSEAEAEAPSPAPSALVGFDFPAVLQILRKPDTVQNSALSVVWTYSETSCTLRLYFYPDIQTSTFHLLKFDLRDPDGGKLDDGRGCMKQLGR